MRLSEAILLGSTTVKQSRGELLVSWYDGLRGCALGMACAAESIPVERNEQKGFGLIYRHWPWTMKVFGMPCGCKEWREVPAAGIIAHIFDMHIALEFCKVKPAWTLEQLVDWVRSVEPSEPNHEEPARFLGRDPVETSQELCSQAKKDL